MDLSFLRHLIRRDKRQPAMTEAEIAAGIAELDDALLVKLAVDFIGHAREQAKFRVDTRLEALVDLGLAGARDIVGGRAAADTAEGFFVQLKGHKKGLDWVACPQGAIIAEATESVLRLIRVQHDQSKSKETLASSAILVARVARDALAGGLTGKDQDAKREAEHAWQHERWVQALAQARLSYTQASAPLPTERSRRSLLAS